MAVLKTSFRFPEINLGFVTSALGAGHLIPKKSQGRGAFDQRKGPRMVENFTKKNKKCQLSEASARMHGHMTSRKRVKILICIIEAVFVSTNKRETLRPVLKERIFSATVVVIILILLRFRY